MHRKGGGGARRHMQSTDQAKKVDQPFNATMTLQPNLTVLQNYVLGSSILSPLFTHFCDVTAICDHELQYLP